MPLKVNGHTVPYSAVGGVVIALSWLIGLSYQVGANDTAIEKHVPEDQQVTTEVKERLATIEANQTSNKEDIEEIKDAQKEQSKMLDRILQAVE